MNEKSYYGQWVGQNLREQTAGNSNVSRGSYLLRKVTFHPPTKIPCKSVITAKVWVALPAPQKHQQQKSVDPRESVKKCQQSDRSFYG